MKSFTTGSIFIGFLSFLYPLFLQTADLQKARCILVVGSCRNSESQEPYFVKTLWQESPDKLTYTNRENVITIDIQGAKNPGYHIVADAATIDCSQLKDITTLYLERPITFQSALVETNLIEAIHTNTVADYIKNLLPALSQGNKIIVEWHPFIARLHLYTGMEKQYVENPDLIKSKKTNPFTGFFDTMLSLIATRLAINADLLQTYEPSFIEEAQKLVPFIQRFRSFYVAQGFKINEINKKLLLETEILYHIYNEDKKQNNVETIQIPVDPADTLTEFNTKVDHVYLITHSGKKGIKLTQKNDPIKNAKKYVYFSKKQISFGTLYYFLWSDIAVETNKNEAIECLRNLGLTNITLERGASPYNHRKNVWLFSGFKQ